MGKFKLGIILFILTILFIGCDSEKESFFAKEDFQTFYILITPNKYKVSTEDIESFSLDILIKNNFQKQINDNVEIYVNGNIAFKEQLLKSLAGEYTIYAKYKGVLSEKIKILVEEPKITTITVNPNKSRLKSNGIDEAILEVQVKDQFEKTMDESPEIYVNGTKIFNNKFKTNVAGTYIINAKIGTVISKDIFIEVDERLISKIELNIDKKKIIPNGEDRATLSYILRDQYGNEMENEEVDIYINGNKYEELTFTTTEYSNYVIVAQYESIISNELVITSGQQSLAELKMITDKFIINPDNNDKATFQFTLKDDNGLEIKNPNITVYLNEEEYNNTEFKTGEYGIYNFYAKSGDLISNTIKIETTNAIFSKIELKASKTLIKPNNEDEVEFNYTYKDQFDYEIEVNENIDLFKKVGNSYEKINGNKFKTIETGNFEFYAQIGEIKSNTLIISTEEKILEKLELKSNKLEIEPNGIDTITFEVNGFDQFNNIMDIQNEKIYQIINGEEIEVESFNTDSYGEFKFIAKVNNISSNTIIVKADNENPYYSTNRIGFGINKTITIDGEISDWNESMKIAQGAAWDIANNWKGEHENSVLDSYALYASWDDSNLYIGWQMVNTTDTWAIEGDGPLSDEGRILDVPLMIALDIGNKDAMTGKMKNNELIWNIIQVEFETRVDHLFLMSGKVGLGTPAMFIAKNSSGDASYEEAYCQNFTLTGIEYAMAEGSLSEEIIGLDGSKSPEDVYNFTGNWIDMMTKGHERKYDSFYEMSIPLEVLGIDKAYIEENGIGVMQIATRIGSAIDSMPHDPSMLDNALVPYSSDDSTSAEKDDTDVITVPLARIGK